MSSERPWNALESGLLDGLESSIVVGLGGDLVDQLGVGHLALGVHDDDGAGQQVLHRAVGEGDAEILAEVGAEGRGDDDVLDSLGAAEAGLGEGKVTGNAQHGGVVESGSLLVEGAHALRADTSVEAREDVEDELVTLELVAGQLRQIGLDEGE